MAKQREKNWQIKEKDYVAALVQLGKQSAPYNPAKRIPHRKLKMQPGTCIPIQTINGLSIKCAIQLALGR